MKHLQSINEFPHRYQSKGYTCGPTAIRILLDFLKYPEDITEEYIEKISGTNNIFGCTDVNMARGLDALGIKYEHIVGAPEIDSIGLLIAALEDNKKVILRTLTKGIKHWIVVYGYFEQVFYCSDPWLGKISYDESQILDIWRPRNFDAFIIITDTSHSMNSNEDKV